MARVSKFDVLMYINKYIRNEHPMYFREFGEGREKTGSELRTLIENIYRELDATPNVDGDKIVGGNAYQEIDKLVDKYIKEIFSEDEIKDIEEKFNMFCDYVKGVIKEDGKITDEAYLEKTSWYVTGIIGRKFDYRKKAFFHSRKMILDSFTQLDFGIKNYPRIEKIISSSNEASKQKIGFDERTLDKIYCDISVEMYKQNIPFDKVNQFVVNEFIKMSKRITDGVIKRVRDVIKVMQDPFSIRDDKVVFEISFEATMSGEICAVDLIDGKLDDHIRTKAESYRLRQIPDYKVYAHVYNVLVNEANEDISDRELRDYTSEVVNELRNKYGFIGKDIVLQKCDDIIKKLYLEKFHKHYITSKTRMKEQSVKQDKTQSNKPVDYVKRNKIVRRIQQETAKLLVALVIGGALGVAAGTYVNRREDNESISIVQSLDETNYSINHSSSIMEKITYEDAINGVVNYYNDLKVYGDKYTALSFYNAYNSNSSITEMDSIFRKVKYNALKNESANGLDELVKDFDCYYEYMYDFLLKMDCVEILDDKYMSAIVSYKQSFYGHSYGIVSDFHIYKGDRLNLERMTELYEEYSRKMQIELGEKIKNMDTDSFADGRTGRSI